MKVTIEIGPLCAPLTEQLRGVLPVAELEARQADAAALNRVFVHGLLTETHFRQAAKRLIRKLQVAVKRKQEQARQGS